MLSSASTSYSFTYDLFGNTTEISAGGNTLAEYTYNENNGKLDTMTYGNGLQVKYFYDTLDRISRIQYNNGEGYVNKYRYEYDGAGRLRLMYDYETYTYTMYDYDPSGRLLKSYNYRSGKILDATSYTYDDKSRVTSMIYSLDYIYDTYVDAYEWTHTYAYDENTDLLSGMNISMSSLTASLSYTYDSLNMLSAKTAAFFDDGDASFYNRTSYEYDEARTSRVYKYRSEVGVSSTGTLSATEYNFTYDSNGNITQIKDANGVIQNKYYYDNLGQLIREDNRAKNKTYVWTYDNAGNRTSESVYAFTTGALGAVTASKTYSYSTSAWGDLMTFDGTKYIDYDEIGNPIRIYQDEGSFIHGYELTWEGRRLTAYTYFEESGNSVYRDTPTTYTYNADGIRTSKTTYSGTKYEYALDGSRIISQTWSNKIFVFVYDENGSPIGINYATADQSALDYFASYYFEKNLQGDIIAIYNYNGVKIGTYTYDAWGNVTQTYLTSDTTDRFIVNNNPFRYRGYYYDTDTKFYYLQTRYYNPANGRFLNGDGLLMNSLLGYNLFSYCSNNPITFCDCTGMCQHNQSVSPCENCSAGITEVDPNYNAAYENAKKKQKPQVNVDELEDYKIRRAQEAAARDDLPFKIPDEEEYDPHAMAQNLTTTILGGFAQLLGLGGKTAVEAATLSGLGYVITTPISITFHWTNDNLSTTEKWIMTGYEGAVAVGGVALTYGVVNCWNPSGWVCLAVGSVYTIATWDFGNFLTSCMAD